MISFSFSSVYMTVLMSNVLLIVITFCFRNENLLMNIGYKLMAVFCFVTLVRLLFPFELPITMTLLLPKAISDAIAVVRHPYGTALGIDISLWTGFCVVWIAGVIVQWMLLEKDHKIVRNYARTYGVNVTDQEPYASILMELCTEKQRRHIKVVRTKGVDIPMVFGLRNAKILLPEDVDVSDADTLYAIKHEIYHYAHHDLWIKRAVNCLMIVYWWNLCSHILKRQIDMLMEMRIDNSVMDKGSEEAVAYVTSMHHYAVNADRRQREKEEAPLFKLKNSELHYRLRMMQSRYNKVNYWVCISMLLVMVSLYIGSYLFTLEASAYGSEVAEFFTTMPEDSTYAIKNEDGTYDIYLDGGIYLETTDTLEYYSPDITIYSSEEEYHEKNP